MEPNQNEHPELPQALTSAEYRARLTTKLNCLIAVLEVAIGKISKSMDVPGANEERLTKIRSNLENTLAICNRAKATLEKTGGVPKATRQTASAANMTARDYVELSSIEEYRKFRSMTPIAKNEIQEIDFDELARRLMDA